MSRKKDSTTTSDGEASSTDDQSTHHQFSIQDSRGKRISESSNLLKDADSQVGVFTVEEAIDSIGFGKFQLVLVLVTGLFSATDALEMMLLSVLSPELRCDWQLESWQIASITTIVFIGMFFGSTLWGKYCDRLGRLPIMKIAAVFVLYFGLLASFSPNFWWILILRGLVGFGFGGAIQSFTLLCEYLPSKYRAKVLIVSSISWSVGALFEVLMAYLIIPTLGWRYLIAASALPSFITLFFIWRLPESARYLLSVGKSNEVTKVLEDIAKKNKSQVPKGQLVQGKKSTPGRFQDLFSKQYARTTLHLLVMWFGVAFVYYGVILTQSELLERGGACQASLKNHEVCKCQRHSNEDFVSMIIATLGEFAVIPINYFGVDHLGRRLMISINFLLAGTLFLLVQICAPSVVLTILMFGVRTFISGVFATIYIYTGEVFPTTIRSIGLGICSSMGRVGCMITPFIAQVLMEFSMHLAISIYGCLCIACAFVTYFLPIETKGREMPQSHDT